MYLHSPEFSQKTDENNTALLENTAKIQLGRLILNKTNRTVFMDDDKVELTTAEFDVFWFLAGKAGQTVSRDELYNEVLSMNYDGLNRCLDLRIARLRKKLGKNGLAFCSIKSIRSEGYLLVPNLN